jgi:hypothetical protein
MPYQPYDTGWIKFVYGALCLTWFLSSNGLPPHLMSVACYNNIFVPFTKLINKLCELLGNVIVLFGSGIIRCESAVFSYFNYIDPVFDGIQYIKSIFDNINIDIASPPPQLPQYSLKYSKVQDLNRKALMFLFCSQTPSSTTAYYYIRFKSIEE